jgi:SOS-response transcriptional repressor LexA
MAMMGLTERQKTALIFIARHMRETGSERLPSYRALRHYLNCGSASNAHRIVQALIERGHLRRLPRGEVALASTQFFRFDDDTKQFVEWQPSHTRKSAQNQGAGR